MTSCLNGSGRSLARARHFNGTRGSGVRFAMLLVVATVASSSLAQAGGASVPLSATEHAAGVDGPFALTYAKQPLRFEENVGQDAKRSGYLAHGRGYTVRLRAGRAELALSEPRPKTVSGRVVERPEALHTLTMQLAGANQDAAMTPEGDLGSTSSYFGGALGTKTGLRNFGRVRYREVYKNADLAYYGKDGRLEYDLVLRPGADEKKIEMLLDGAESARIDMSGNLLLSLGGREVRFLKPVAYQEANEGRAASDQRPVDVGYVLKKGAGKNRQRLSFRVGAYDHAKTLVIDPVLDYATYLDAGDNLVVAMTADAAGNTYLVTEAGYDSGFEVLKFDPNGNQLASGTVVSTGGYAIPTAIAASASGAVYVSGYGQSGLPTTANAYQSADLGPSPGQADAAFLAVFSLNLSTTPSTFALSYCSYIGGNAASDAYGEAGLAVAVDSAGAAYVAGTSQSGAFPATPGVYQSAYLPGATSSAFVAKFDPSKSGASSLVYATLLGGAVSGQMGLAVDSAGNAYVTGSATSTPVPVTAGSISYSGGNTSGPYAYVTKLNPTGTAVVYSANLGPGGGNGIAVDVSGDTYVTGSVAGDDFPTTAGAYQTTYPGGFLSELNPAGSALIYSTFLGGPSGASYYGAVTPVNVALKPGCASACAAYVSGVTTEADFPAINAIQSYQGGVSPTGFLVEVAAGGASAAYSTYLGAQTATELVANFNYLGNLTTVPAVAVDAAANAYVAGNVSAGYHYFNGIQTFGADFPVTPSPAGPASPGGTYLAKIGPAVASNVVATPTSVAYNSAYINIPSTPTPVVLRNMGSKAVTISSILPTPGDEFSETDNCNGAIAGGAECTLNVVFTPEASGTRSGTISVLTSASTTPLTISVTGSASDQPYLQFSPSTLAFADQVVGTVSAAQIVTLTNISHTPATSFIEPIGSGFVSANNCPSMLDPGTSCQFSIQFAPANAGLITGNIYTGAQLSTTTTVSGTGIAAGTGGSGSSVLSPSALNLGSLLMGTTTSTSSPPTIYLSNTGTVPVTVQSISVALTSATGNVNDFSYYFGGGNTFPATITPETNQYLQIFFTPSVVGTETATITVTDSSGNSPHVATITGVGLAATQTLEFTPGNQVFADQPVGFASAAQTFQVFVTGTAPVTVDRVLTTGDFQVSTDACSGMTLQPANPPGTESGGGYSCYVNVTFTPTATGARTGTLTLVDSATGEPQVLNLMGNGIAATGMLVVDPTAFTFPAQAVGTTSGTQFVVLSNGGNSPITVNSITPTGDFAVTPYQCPAVPFAISQGATCGAILTFTPTATGTRSGTLTIGSSGGNQTVTLTGTGITVGQAIAFTPGTTFNFGSIPYPHNSSGNQVYVRNTGTEPVTFTGKAAVTGHDAGDYFAITNDQCTNVSSLAAGASCRISLSFEFSNGTFSNPSDVGVKSGTLTLTDSAGTQTLALTATNTGTPALAVNAPDFAFDQIPVMTQSPLGIYNFYNYGPTGTIQIASVAITSGGTNFSIGPARYNTCSSSIVRATNGCGVGIYFNPTTAGYLTGAITFTDTSGNTYTGALSGYSEPALNAAVLTPAGINFGDVILGNTQGNYTSYQVVLQNTGPSPLTVGAVTGINFGSGAEFSVFQNASGYDTCSNSTIAGNSTCVVYLQFTPSATGSRTGTVVFPVTYAGSSTPVNLTATLAGTGVADKNTAILTPSAVTFIDQVVGTSSTLQPTILLKNTGNIALTVGSVTGTNYGSSGEFGVYTNNPGYDACSNQPVAPGGACSIYVQFTPSATGSRTGTMVFPVTYSGATTAVNLTATLSGKGIAQVNSAVLSPTALNFGPIPLATTSGAVQANSILVTNQGNQTFSIGTLAGTNYGGTGEFGPVSGDDSCSNVTLVPGGICRVYVQFTPSVVGTRNGTVVFPVTYAGTTTPVNFTATLTGLGAVATSGAVLAPNPRDFGNVLIGTTAPTAIYETQDGFIIDTVNLLNNSAFPLAIGAVTGTNFGTATSEFGLYSANRDECSNQTIPPQRACLVIVSFTPKGTGTRTGTLVFPVTYAGATTPVNLTATVTGVGLAANTTLAFSQNPLAFGTQAVGTSSGQATVQLFNYSGSVSVPITSVVLGGANASDFSETDSCTGNTVTPGNSCGVNVTFAPSATSLGSRTATVTETDPATGSPRVLTLTGTGVADASAVKFYPASLAFATNETVNEGTAGKIVGLNYAGTLPLSVTSVTSSDPADFPVVEDGCSGGTVATGAACQITIAFTPTKTGTLSATISVVDSGTGSPQKFTVTGGGSAVVTTTTTLVATPASGAFGSLFTLVATVKDAGGNPVKNGTVTFAIGTGATAKQLGSVQVVTTASGGGTVGTATYKTLYLPLGVNSIKAHYLGADGASVSAAATVTVTGKYPSSTVLSSSGVEGNYTLVGTVSGAGPDETALQTGSVVFNDAQATSALGTATLDATTAKETGVNVSTRSIGTGSSPTALVLADVNGDGIPDILASYNNNAFAFSVLLGNGDGTYKAAQPVAGVLGGPVSKMVVGDFNGDGKLDLALSGNLVEVFLGNGDGTFQPEVDYDNSGVESIALGDLNGDGILDLVAGNAATSSVDLLIGNGDGTFQNPVSTFVGGGFGLIAADINGDGKIDVAVQDATRNGIDVLLGNGNGTFLAAKFSPTSYFPYRLAGGDFNGDGKFDLVTNDNDTSIGILFGNGDGTFQSEQVLVSSVSVGQQVVADVNGDGNADIILPDFGANTVDIYSGNGDGTFQPVISYPTGQYPVAVKVADLNSDGRPDFVVVNQSDGTASVFLNQVTETATLTGVTLPGVKSDAVTAIYSGDTNYSGSTSNVLTLASNPPGTTVTLAATPTTGAQGTVFKLTATVVDGTGAPVTGGVVEFLDNGTALASVEVVSATGVATFETRSLTLGSNVLTATFTGTDLSKPGTTGQAGAVTVTVTGKYATTTALSATGVEGSYALTATVDGFGLGSPSGSVVFTDASTSTTLGTVPMTSAGLMSSFVQLGSLATGNNPGRVVSGDFNGDGKPDLAVVNFNDATVSIFLGNGDGTFFSPSRTFATGSEPSSVAAGDFNGDGKLDLAISNYGSANLSILLGNGDGSFQPQVTFAAGAVPESIKAVDFNGDGKVDLVVVNAGANNVGVLLGNGDGSFQAQTTYPVGRTPEDVAIGDFNGDGNLDLAVLNYSDNTVSILLGGVNGLFGSQNVFTVPNAYYGLATADVNGDGRLDLVTAAGPEPIAVLLGNGDGTFGAARTYGSGADAHDVLLADVNGDGKLDAVFSTYVNAVGNVVGVLLGNGDGSFQASQGYGSGTQAAGIAAVDLNGDGRLDIVSINSGSNNVSVLLGVQTEGVSLTGVTLPGSDLDNVVASYSGDSTFATSTSNTVTLPSHPLATTTTLTATPATGALGSAFTLTATVADAHGNAVINGTVTFYSGTGAGSTALQTVQLVEVSGGGQTAGTATLKTLDLPLGSDSLTAVFNGTDTDAMSISAAKTVTVTGKYATTTTLAATGSVGDYTLTATVAANAPLTPGGSVLFTDTTTNQSLGTGALPASSTGLDFNVAGYQAGAGPTNVAAGDLNGDGIQDMVFGSNSGQLIVLLGKDDGTFALSAVNTSVEPVWVTLADVNGDGKLDLVSAWSTANTASVWLGNGDGTFQAPVSYPVDSTPYRVVTGDVNGDGRADLLTVNGAGTIDVLLGNGDGTFRAAQSYPTGCVQAQTIALGDLNHDGKLDVVSSDDNCSFVSVLLGNGDGSFQTATTFPANNYLDDVELGDLNGDGKLDVVTAGYSDGTVGVLLGNGDGTLQAETFYPVVKNSGSVAPGPYSIALGDLNHDGKLDVVAPTLNGVVSVLLGNGDGTLQAAVPTSTGGLGSAGSVVIADFNGDGRPDVATVNDGAGSPSVSVLLNQLSETTTLTHVSVPGTGTHNVTATYSGDTNFTGSTSSPIQLAATLSPTTIALTALPSANHQYYNITYVNVALSSTNGVPFPPRSVTYNVDGGPTSTSQATNGNTPIQIDLGLLAPGNHTLTVNYLGDTTHAAAQQSLAITITKSDQTITFAGIANTTYGAGPFGVAPTASPSNLPVSIKVVSGPAVITNSGAIQVTGAGTVVIEADQAGNADYNAATAVQQSFAVAQKALSVVVGAATKVYGTANPAFTSTVTGLVGNDAATVTYATTATTNSPLGTYPITATVSGAGIAANYAVTVTPGVLTVTKTVLTVTVANATRAYGAANPTFTGTITGLVGTDTATATYSTTATAASVLGSYPITATVTGSDLSNYTLNVVNGSLSVTQAALTLTVNNASRTYGAANPAFSGVYTGLANGDTVTGTYSTTATVTSNAGQYAINAMVSGAAAANYSVTVVPGMLTVTKAALTVAVNSFSRVYGSPLPTYTGTLTGLLNGDAVVAIYSSSAQLYSPVGQYAINATVSGAAVANYNLSVTAGTLTVTPAILTIVVNNASKVVGTANPAFTGTVTGLLNNDAVVVAYSSTATMNSSVGTYAIVATISGAAAGNYNAQVTAGTLTILGPLGTTTVLSATPTTGAVQTLVTLTATVADAHGAAVTYGTVTFFDGTTALGTVQLTEAAGTATLKTLDLPPGSDVLTAVFNGTDPDLSSTSAAKTVTLTGKYVTTTALAGTGSDPDFTLTATVNGYGPPMPGGSVVFTDTTNNVTLGTVALSAATPGYNLAAQTALTGFDEPDTAAVGDFNGDGKPDLAITNFYGPVSVYLSNGDGTFQAPTNYTVGSGAGDIVAFDLNGDGKLDLLLVNYEGNTISVLLGNGDGTFQAQQVYPAGNGPSWISLGDFNGDGKIDFAVPNYRGDTVSIFLGNGDGTFQPHVDYALASGPGIAAVGDFNGDGKLDLAVGQQKGTTVSIMLGNGDGTFQSPRAFAAGSGPEGVGVADFNGDGKLDLAVSNFNDNTISLLLGKGDGTFAAQQVFQAGAGTGPDALSIGDINGDGKLDLVVANNSGNSVGVFLGNGDGTFAAPQTIAVGSYPEIPTLADLNGDGRLDIVMPNVLGDNTSVFLNLASETATLTNVDLLGNGPHNVTATYVGDTNFTGSTSSAFQLAATLANATVTLTPSPGATYPYYPGGSIAVAVTSAAGVNTPTGSVSYTINGGTASVAQLSTGGMVTLSLGLLAPGQYSVLVNYSGDSIHATATATQILTVTKSNQTITFPGIGNTTYGAGPFGVAPTAYPSGLPVSIKVVSGPAVITNSGAIQVTGAGTVIIEADQPGNADYNAAASVSQSFTVSKALLTATAANVSRAYGAANPALTYAVTGFVDGDTTAVVSGTATLTTTANATSPQGTTYPITFSTEGLTAANYSFAYVSGTLSVGTAQQTITFGALSNQVYGVSPLTLTATASSGLAVTYTVTGPATVSGSTLTITGAGTVTVTAAQAGNTNFTAAASVTESFTVSKALLTATAANVSRAYGAANPALTYAVTGFVNGDTTAVVSGTATLTTTANATSPQGTTYPITFSTEGLTAANYSFAYVNGVLSVGTAQQTITFGALSNQVYGVAPLTLSATASSGLAVTYTVTGPAMVSGSTLTITGAGTVSVTASQAGNTNFTAAASVSQSFTVSKALLTATAANVSRAYGAANPALTYAVTGFVDGDTTAVVSGTATLTTTANATSPQGTTYPITFSTEGLTAANYSFAYVNGVLSVGTAQQTITFGALSNQVYGVSPIGLTATASSGLAVTYTVTGPATVSGSTLTITGAGTVTVTAAQAGNTNFTAAASVSQSFTVSKALLTATAANVSRAYGAANPALTYAVTGFVDGDTTAVVSGTATLTTTANATSPEGTTYPIVFSTEGLTAANYSFAYVAGVLSVGTAQQTITFGALSNQVYGVSPIGLTATASSGLAVTYTVTGPASISGSTLTITGAGTVTVTASQAGNTNFTAAASVSQSFTVSKALLTATAANVSRAYGAANPALTYAVTGFVDGDTTAVVSGTATLTTTANATSPEGTTYPITFSTEGLTAANYSFAYVAGTLTVSAPIAPSAPSFSLAAGRYTSAQTLVITEQTAGALVYYTLDGTAPSAAAMLYNGSITVSQSETVKAIAIANGASSSITSAAYVIGAAQQCTVIDYSKGFTATGITLNGSAKITGGLLELTDGKPFEAGSAFLSTRVPITGFVTDIAFQLLNPDADGITIAIQGKGAKQVGQYGGGLGYAGIPNSVALKFDLHSNFGEGTDSTGAYLNGAYPGVPSVNLAGTGIDLHSGHVFTVHMAYDGTNTVATLTDTVTKVAVSGDFMGNIGAALGSDTAYFGFTGGTGAKTATQNILSWTYSGGTGCGVSQ